MTEHELPEVRFDESIGVPIFPRPVMKNAVLVPIPKTDAGDEIPTFIKAEWGQLQFFMGDYYAIVNDGVVIYGSAKDQWENMHTLIVPGYWVKTVIPTAYQATESCRIVTLIPDESGSIREANYVLSPGDWIVRQPGGEVQHVKAAKYDGIYYLQEEAVALGLTDMTAERFVSWAVGRVRVFVPN